MGRKSRFIQGDACEEMGKLPDKSVDLVITSPPYNLRNTTGGYLKQKNDSDVRYPRLMIREGYDGYQDNLPHEQYVEWQRQCIAEMMRLLKPTGAIFYNHKWRVQNGLLQDRKDIVSGFPVRQIIIWAMNGGFNNNPHYFLPSYEVIYLIAKADFRLRSSSLTDLWKIPRDKNNNHPAPFPVAIPERALQSCYGNVVLDPFVGSGSTAVAAKRLGWDYIGIDISKKYLGTAIARVEKTSPLLI